MFFQANDYLCRKFQAMRRLLLLSLLVLLGLGLASCQKSRYCQCYATVDDKTVGFGEEIPGIEDMTAAELDGLDPKYRYNLFVMEHHRSCEDKEKEFQGWTQVVCEEVDPKRDDSWFWNLFNHNNNSNNNNNNNNNNHNTNNH